MLAHPLVLAASGFMCFVEFFADKIPGVDSLWDVVHTLIRIPAGAALAASVFGDSSSAAMLAAAILGGDARGGQPFHEGRQPGGDQHVARAVLQLGCVVHRGPRRRRLALARHGASACGAGVLVVLIALMIWLLPKLWRMVRAVVARLTTWLEYAAAKSGGTGR